MNCTVLGSWFAALLLLLTSACGRRGHIPVDVDAGIAAPSREVFVDPEDKAATIYDQSKFRTFKLEIEQADLDMLNSSPAAEMYVSGTLIFQGKTYADVGVRYKGSVGAFQAPCVQGGSLVDHSGPKGGKCSIKVSFNWKDPDRRFFGLKKLVFHSMNNDPSFMRERLGYAMFREMGVPAPRATHAKVAINGQVEGVFALVEEIDGRFTRSRFAEGGKGNLYKEIWPIYSDPQLYVDALESNRDQDPSVEGMLRFKDAVLSGPEATESWLDRQMIAAYLAVDRVILNDDGIFHFWCSPGGSGNNPETPANHNYYWYESEAADHMWLVPWDLDYSFTDPSTGGLESLLIHVSTDWTQPPATCGCASVISQGPAACDPLIMNFQAWIEDYNEEVDAFLKGPFSARKVNAKLDSWTAQIDDAVSKTAGTNSAPSYETWKASVDTLRQVVANARANRGYPY